MLPAQPSASLPPLSLSELQVGLTGLLILSGTSPNKSCVPLLPFWILLLEGTKLTYHFEYIILDN